MTNKEDDIQEWLDKGNKIKVLPYYEPKIKKCFGKVSSKMRRLRTSKGKNK
jgi:hypothetical protein